MTMTLKGRQKIERAYRAVRKARETLCAAWPSKDDHPDSSDWQEACILFNRQVADLLKVENELEAAVERFEPKWGPSSMDTVTDPL